VTSPVSVALPWYHRQEYAELLALFSDPEKMPPTFDAWLEHAERVEKQLLEVGFVVARVWIRPSTFSVWCEERNASLDQRARLTFANEFAREHHRAAQ
jgi:hypothetical protein